MIGMTKDVALKQASDEAPFITGAALIVDGDLGAR